MKIDFLLIDRLLRWLGFCLVFSTEKETGMVLSAWIESVKGYNERTEKEG